MGSSIQKTRLQLENVYPIFKQEFQERIDDEITGVGAGNIVSYSQEPSEMNEDE